jgi:hypothetical protein
MAYQGNQNLRSANEKIVYTPEMKKEFIRCYSDIIHFGEEYCHIITIDEGKVKIKFWDFQKKMIKAMYDPPEYRNAEGQMEKKKFLIVLSPRQVGKTTVSAVYLTHYAIFNEHKTIAILANKEKTALEILSRIKMIYEGLPLWLQPGIVDGGWNKQSITLGNGSRIIATSTASSAIRGYTINSLFLDEFAFVPPQIAEEFMNSVYPTVSSGKTSKIIIVSTPNGMNHFYNIWIDAIRGKNSYFPIKINWWEVPGRDDNFKKEIIRNQGITSWNQEYNCNAGESIINIRNKENGLIKSVSCDELWKYGNKIFDK